MQQKDIDGSTRQQTTPDANNGSFTMRLTITHADGFVIADEVRQLTPAALSFEKGLMIVDHSVLSYAVVTLAGAVGRFLRNAGHIEKGSFAWSRLQNAV